MKRNVKLEVFYAWPVDKVWAALTDSKAIAQWLMANDFEPKVGHKFQFRAKPQPGWNGITACEVIEVQAPKRLAYTWCNTERTLQTVVRWTLEPQGAGTRLVLEHDGFEGFKHVLLSFMMGSGWKRMLKKKFQQAMKDLEAGSPLPQGPDAHCEDSDTFANRVVGKIAGGSGNG